LTALRHRDRSEAELERRLASKGFVDEEREHALETLRRTGLVDDRRFAESRAAALAARGAGDALIRHDLGAAGVGADEVEEALAGIAPEQERARAVVERRGPGPKTRRYLGAKGFSEETVSALSDAL
jgi:regulatory protein